MEIIQNLLQQFRSLIPVLIKVYLPVALLLIGIGLLRLFFDVDIGKITRDPVQIMNGDPLEGMLSNVGILFWCATAAICSFGSIVLRNQTGARSFSFFLFASACVTSLLLFDDFFLLHEMVFPMYLHLPQNLVYALYVMTIAAFLIFFYERILATEYILLILALSFFGLSIFIDILDHFISVPAVFLFEDGFKFFGIVTWMFYFVRVSFDSLTNIKNV